jgi:hypothetical protein
MRIEGDPTKVKFAASTSTYTYAVAGGVPVSVDSSGESPETLPPHGVWVVSAPPCQNVESVNATGPSDANPYLQCAAIFLIQRAPFQ